MNNRYFSLLFLGMIGFNILLILFNLMRVIFDSFKHTTSDGDSDALEQIDRLREGLKNINTTK